MSEELSASSPGMDEVFVHQAGPQPSTEASFAAHRLEGVPECASPGCGCLGHQRHDLADHGLARVTAPRRSLRRVHGTEEQAIRLGGGDPQALNQSLQLLRHLGGAAPLLPKRERVIPPDHQHDQARGQGLGAFDEGLSFGAKPYVGIGAHRADRVVEQAGPTGLETDGMDLGVGAVGLDLQACRFRWGKVDVDAKGSGFGELRARWPIRDLEVIGPDLKLWSLRVSEVMDDDLAVLGTELVEDFGPHTRRDEDHTRDPQGSARAVGIRNSDAVPPTLFKAPAPIDGLLVGHHKAPAAVAEPGLEDRAHRFGDVVGRDMRVAEMENPDRPLGGGRLQSEPLTMKAVFREGVFVQSEALPKLGLQPGNLEVEALQICEPLVEPVELRKEAFQILAPFDGERTPPHASGELIEPGRVGILWTSTGRTGAVEGPGSSLLVRRLTLAAGARGGGRYGEEEGERDASNLPDDAVPHGPRLAQPQPMVKRTVGGNVRGRGSPEVRAGGSVLKPSPMWALAGLVLATPAPVDAAYTEPRWAPQLTEVIEVAVRDYPGRFGLQVVDVVRGEAFGYREEAPMYLASGVKLAFMVAAFRAIESKSLSLEEELLYSVDDERDGSPELNQRDVGVRVRVAQLLEWMIRLSDNAASDLIADRLGMEAIQAGLVAEGIYGFSPLTRLIDVRRGIYRVLDVRADDLSAHEIRRIRWTPIWDPQVRRIEKLLGRPRGTHNAKSLIAAYHQFYATGVNKAPMRAVAEILSGILAGTLVSKAASEAMLELMSGARTSQNRLLGQLPEGIDVAHKTGSQYLHFCDLGIVFLPTSSADRESRGDPLVVTMCTEDGPLEISETLMATVARRAYDLGLEARHL